MGERNILKATLNEDYDMVIAFAIAACLFGIYMLLFLFSGSVTTASFLSIIFIPLGIFIPLYCLNYYKISISFLLSYFVLIIFLPDLIDYRQFTSEFLASVFIILQNNPFIVAISILAPALAIVLPVKFVISKIEPKNQADAV